MFKNTLLEFKLWLEDSLEERKIREMFLRRLGFDPSAMKDTSVQTMKINSYKDKIIKALENLGLVNDKLELLMNWVRNNPQSTLQNLINQIDYKDLEDNPDANNNLPGVNAKLPKGQPKPKPQPNKMNGNMPTQQAPQDQMMMGNPPKQGNMQVPF